MNDGQVTLKLGKRAIVAVGERPKRLSLLLWGSAGTGKTSLACTAPGRKLLVNFDPDGHTSVAHYPDTHVIDYSDPDTGVTDAFKSGGNPLGLDGVIDQFDTIIVDSLTNVGFKTLTKGVSTVKGATVERPSPGAYQVRNALTLQLVKNILSYTNKLQKHVVFIAHENTPVTDEEGNVIHITLALGGQLPEQTALDFSEVWCLQDMGGSRPRRLLIRATRSRKPLKTRMFETRGEPEFEWDFNADDPTAKYNDGMRIEDWFNAWVSGGSKKLPLPKRRK